MKGTASNSSNTKC